jgi:acyl-CoA reductase-like NAD-dependent aldehyde dehydrogenase
VIETEAPALLWLGGSSVPAISGETFPVLDPATEEVIGEAALGLAEDIDRAVEAARAALRSPSWRDLDPYRRGRLLLAWARRIDSDAEPIARLLSRENGKPLSEARDEVETTVRYIEYYAGWADKFDGRVLGVPGGALEYVLHEPLGVVGHVVPWNYPLDVFARGVAPALTAGNTIVAKPSAETPLSTLYVARLSDEVGMPPGVLNVVSGFGADAGAHLAGHGGIDGLAFCGSVATGREVLRAAAERITPVVSLELGGKSAKIVFDDADIDAAATAAAHGVTYNAGQSCGTQSRVLVPRARADDFAGRVRDVLAGVRVGRGLDDPDMGPLVSEAQLDRVIEFIESGRSDGAQVMHGGDRQRSPGDRGYFIEPTLFVGARPGMRIIDEEIFGPVVSLLPFDSEEEAIEIANATDFGLSASIWTRDLGRAHRVARQLNVSVVAVNGGGGFDVESPWGGVKQSGFGREGAIESLLQYSRVKAVWIDIPDAPATGGRGGDMSEERSQ